MGTFAEYSGKLKIAEYKKKEYVTNMLKILNYGGMMHLDEVNMYGKKIMLISPLTLDSNNHVSFRYNYFEDDSWETAEFDANSCYLRTQKIGSYEFCDTIAAAYVLQELYDEEPGVAMVDGNPLDYYFYAAWISQLLEMKFTMEKRFKLWECVESNYLHELERGYDSENVDFEYVMKLVPKNLRRAMGGVEFADIFLMCKGTKELEKNDILPGTYPEMILKCKEALLKYFNGEKSGKEEKLNAVRSLVKSSQCERQKIKGKLEEVAKLSLKLSAKVILYLLSEVYDLNFWEEWKEIREESYSDEEVSDYAPEELLEWRNENQKEIIQPIGTAQALEQDSDLFLYDIPEQLKGKPKYFLSDDDRAFWWDGTDEVIFSERMEQWLVDLAKRHKQITEELNLEGYDNESFLREMTEALFSADVYYKRVFAFQNMFYDFLQNSTDMRYVAAIKLFEAVCEENKKAGKIIEHLRDTWELTNKNIKCNEGRMNIKRYLGVMANKKLREKYFGF